MLSKYHFKRYIHVFLLQFSSQFTVSPSRCYSSSIPCLLQSKFAQAHITLPWLIRRDQNRLVTWQGRWTRQKLKIPHNQCQQYPHLHIYKSLSITSSCTQAKGQSGSCRCVELAAHDPAFGLEERHVFRIPGSVPSILLGCLTGWAEAPRKTFEAGRCLSKTLTTITITNLLIQHISSILKKMLKRNEWRIKNSKKNLNFQKY